MGKMLEALLRLQSVELRLGEVRSRLNTQIAAVEDQQERIARLQADQQRLHTEVVDRQRKVAAVELELKSREEQVVRLRGLLNTAKTNKEYASILTQLNTVKADNSKLEDQALALMQDVDQVRQRVAEVSGQVEQAGQALREIQATSAAEIARLGAMLADLQKERAAAAEGVTRDALAVFERIAATRDGRAMANIEIQGKKPPHEYSCGGCYMSIAAENANALRTRDELRFCDNCGRILYLDEWAGREDEAAADSSEQPRPQEA